MKLSHKIALSSAAIASFAAAGAGIIHAAEPAKLKLNPMSGLVTAIATKFNLNVTDVQQVFDEQHAKMGFEMKVKHDEMQKERLDQAVKDGKLTQAQADLVIAKQAEMKTFGESLKDMSEEDRHTAMKAHMDAMQTWAKENNIPPQFIGPFVVKFRGTHGAKGFGGENVMMFHASARAELAQ